MYARSRAGERGLFTLSLDISFGGESFHLERDFRSKSQTIRRRGRSALRPGEGVDEFLRGRLALADQNFFLRICGVRHEELGAVGRSIHRGEDRGASRRGWGR